jgi:exosortase A-associated hydrolase 1
VKYTERVVTFNCAQEALVGILAVPQTTAGFTTGVIVIVGGPQYRAGSHRQFVLLSRALATGGYPVLRFDYRGMGDSNGALRDFRDVSSDIRTAIDAMQQHLPSVSEVALWGLCDGASAALLYCDETNDARVRGLCLLNPWVRSEASLARAHVKHYYTQRLRQKEFWFKLLSGKVALAALRGFCNNLRLMGPDAKPLVGGVTLPFQLRMAKAWSGFRGGILLLLSGDDYTAKEFLEYASMDSAWTGLLEKPTVARHELPEADHTFSDKTSRGKAELLALEWLQDLPAS